MENCPNPKENPLKEIRENLCLITDLVGASPNNALCEIVQTHLEKAINFFHNMQNGTGYTYDPSAGNPLMSQLNLHTDGNVVAIHSFPQVLEYDKKQLSAEKERVQKKLNNFDPKSSPAWEYISKKFGAEVKQQCLCEMAKYLALKNELNLDRDSKRRKSVLIKWFHDNWNIIKDDIKKITIKDDVLEVAPE